MSTAIEVGHNSSKDLPLWEIMGQIFRLNLTPGTGQMIADVRLDTQTTNLSILLEDDARVTAVLAALRRIEGITLLDEGKEVDRQEWIDGSTDLVPSQPGDSTE